jgi:hypothetical protein
MCARERRLLKESMGVTKTKPEYAHDHGGTSPSPHFLPAELNAEPPEDLPFKKAGNDMVSLNTLL